MDTGSSLNRVVVGGKIVGLWQIDRTTLGPMRVREILDETAQSIATLTFSEVDNSLLINRLKLGLWDLGVDEKRIKDKIEEALASQRENL